MKEGDSRDEMKKSIKSVWRDVINLLYFYSMYIFFYSSTLLLCLKSYF
jgi:hypothetical protein